MYFWPELLLNGIFILQCFQFDLKGVLSVNVFFHLNILSSFDHTVCCHLVVMYRFLLLFNLFLHVTDDVFVINVYLIFWLRQLHKQLLEMFLVHLIIVHEHVWVTACGSWHLRYLRRCVWKRSWFQRHRVWELAQTTPSWLTVELATAFPVDFHAITKVSLWCTLDLKACSLGFWQRHFKNIGS